MSISVVEKAPVSAAGIVFFILTGFLRAGYNEFKVEHQMDLDIFQFEVARHEICWTILIARCILTP